MKQNKIILIIILSSLILRMGFRSQWLEDWDSVQFALGLHNFNIVQHQPHPPGFPLFILLGKIANYFTHNDTVSLTFISALFGTFSIVPVFLFTKKVFDKKSAILASLVFTVLPVHWVLSVTPISNITGLFYITTLLYIAYLDSLGEKRITFIGLIAGIFLGVRPTDLPIVVSIILFLAVKRRRPLYIVSLFTGLALGVCLWLIPLVYITGFDNFKNANAAISSYVIWHDMFFGKNPGVLDFIVLRITNLVRLLNIAYSLPILILSIISLANLLSNRFFTTTGKQLILVYFFSYLIPLVFIYNLELAQYTLPLSPIIAILAGNILVSLSPKIASWSISVVIILSLFIRSYAQVEYISENVPPTIKIVSYVKDNFKPEEITLITTYTYRQFQYYAPLYANYYGLPNTLRDINTKYVAIDYLGLKEQIPSLNNYTIEDHKMFSSTVNQFARLNTTNLYILKQ